MIGTHALEGYQKRLIHFSYLQIYFYIDILLYKYGIYYSPAPIVTYTAYGYGIYYSPAPVVTYTTY